jgi:hypothetical protein
MANGEPWERYWEKNNTIACPKELAFGTEIMIDKNIYTCRDRGGAIVINSNGEYWVDILAQNVPYTFGEVRKAYIVERR